LARTPSLMGITNWITKARSALQLAVDDVIQIDGENMRSLWWHSPYDANIFLWISVDGRMLKFQVDFLGQIAEWNYRDGLTTGVILEVEVREPSAATGSFDATDNPPNPLYMGGVAISESIQIDPSPQTATVSVLWEFVSGCELVPSAQQQQILELLDQNKKAV